MLSPGFPPSLDLLAAAGRLSLAPPAQPTISIAPHDWLTMPAFAQRHGMSAWLARAVRVWPGVPEAVRETVDVTARAQSARALHALSGLAHVVTQLDRAGIVPVVLKGPLFSQWLYGDVGARRFADLDLLVARGELLRASEMLGELGYTLPAGMTTKVAATIYAGVGAWPLVGPGMIPLDLHWRSQASRFGPLLDVSEILRDSVRVAVAGMAIRIPGPTHAAALAVVHAAKHLWASLELVLSIAHLIERDDVDWMRVQAIAARAHAWSGAAAGLVLASELFEREMPAPLRGRPLPASVPLLRAAACGFLATARVEDTSRVAEWRAHRAALDTSASRLRYSMSRLVAPTPLEWEWCALPDALAPLYAGVRLVRLSLASLRLPFAHRKKALAPR